VQKIEDWIAHAENLALMYNSCQVTMRIETVFGHCWDWGERK